MADQIDAKVYGFDELAAGSRKLADELAESSSSAFRATAERVAASARMRVPRLSGTLAASVAVGEADEGAQVGIGEGVPYAGWIEFGGTRGRPYVAAGRYLYPTALAAEPLLVAAALTTAKTEIKGARWPTPRPH